MTRAARPAVGVAVIEAARPLPSFDFSTADRWHVLVLAHGTPVARVDMPSPGAVDSAALAQVLLVRHADDALRRHALTERLRERLGGAARRHGPATVSVVVCTHGRPEYLPTALAALAALDPPAHEIVVVDNAPGARDCRAEADAAGARYVREDRKGLDHARAAGIRAATGEVVAFTDDDCVPPPGWIAALREAFADPCVAAVTGPAFPYVLDTPARVRMERQASLTRGIRRRYYDWTLLAPVHGTQVGVGANMAFRRAALEALDDPFPAELDAGTATCSGGDSHAFSVLLAAGQRIVYEPAAFVFHQHRPDWDSLLRAVVGYGTGAAASATKLLVERGELEAPRVWRWLVDQYLRTQLRRLAGRADAVEVRIAWSYLRGGLAGPGAWRRSRRAGTSPGSGSQADGGCSRSTSQHAPGPRPSRAAPPPVSRTRSRRGNGPALSVVVPTVGRPAALRRCLEALAAQTLPAADFEVVVCDDTPGGAERPAMPSPEGLTTRVVSTGGRGAGGARNAGARAARGRVLLFLDDDLVAAPDLLDRHLAAQRAVTARAVIGYSPPRPVGGGLAASGAALWWHAHFDTLATGKALGFADMLSGNMSLPRSVFEAVGGFDEAFARDRREDWELGLRLRRAEIPIAYEPAARADHEYRLDAAARLRACVGEGRGDARLVASEPTVAAYLPLADHHPPSWRRPLRALGFRALAADVARPLLLAALRLLEHGRVRSLWSGLYNRAQRAAYARGLREGGWRQSAGELPPLLELELESSAPIKTPTAAVTPRIALRAGGRDSRLVTLPGGRWHPSAAELLAQSVPARDLARVVDIGTDEPASTPEPADPPWRVVLVCDAGLDAREVARLGVELRQPPRSRPDELWAVVATALGDPEVDLVVAMLPGRRPSAEWLRAALLAFEGPRIGAVVGRALPAGTPAEPLSLADSASRRLPFAPLGPAVDFLALRAAAIRAAPPPPAPLAATGDLAATGWWVEAALERGWVVGHGGFLGLEAPARPDAAVRAEKVAAWAALVAASDLPLRVRARTYAVLALAAARRAQRSIRQA